MARDESSILRRANPSTIQDKVLVGYQGWFTCAGDGEPIGPGHHGWLHWFNSPLPSGGRPNTDLWPDTSEYDPSELYPAPGLTTSTGDPVHLFSSRHPKTVRRHFRWMALHGVDGAFLQRFAGQCEIKSNLGIRDLRDEIGERVREAAEAEGRVFAIMYDVSGVSPDKIQSILEQDWMHLLRDQRVLDSPNYLHEQGRPVVALWGFGLNGRNHTPDLVRAITAFFRSSIPGGVYLMAGTPGHWRTSSSDADRNPAFLPVWTECFDAISPWTIGRYGNEEEADRWGEERVKADAEYLKRLDAEGRRKVDYIPVVFPGGSGFNLSEGKWGMNDIPRKGGQFLWRQIYNARRAGVRTIYCAMWDEYDEGTALIPAVPYSSQLPVHPSFRFVALDVDGYDLPSDWYLRITGFAAEAFHGERILQDTFPVKELQDYWSTRPRCEGMAEGHKQQDDVDGVTRALSEWEVSDVPNEAPPPYSLEDNTVQQGHASNAGGGPPVSYQSRPSPSHSSFSSAAGAAAVTFGAAAAARTLSGGSAGSGQTTSPRSSPRPPPVSRTSRPSTATLPPRVDKSSRPSSASSPLSPSFNTSSRPSPTNPCCPPAEIVMSPPLPARRPSTAYERGRPACTPGTTHFPDPGTAEYRRAPSLGQSAFSDPAMSFPPAPVPARFERGRSRSRSRSRSRHRHGKHKARRSRSRSSSSHRMPLVGFDPHHGHHGHGHGLSYGHGHGMAFPGAPSGLYHAHSEGVYGQGPYVPGHSMAVGHGPPGPPGPVGHSMSAGYVPGHGQGQGQGMYAGPYPSQGYGGPPGHGYGPGYDPSGTQGQGYVQHPSLSSPYYASYGGPGGAGGSGGGLSGNFASALQAVEGIAGKQTRQQLEKTVKTLTNSFNKFK